MRQNKETYVNLSLIDDVEIITFIALFNNDISTAPMEWEHGIKYVAEMRKENTSVSKKSKPCRILLTVWRGMSFSIFRNKFDFFSDTSIH